MVAAGLSKTLGKVLDIKLVESDEIGTVGVGEATIPTLVTFHRLLDINEQEFMAATQGTFKLGIGFENWRDVGRELHPLVRHHRQGSLDRGLPALLAQGPRAQARRRLRRLLPGAEGRAGEPLRAPAARRHELRLPHRREPVREVPAQVQRRVTASSASKARSLEVKTDRGSPASSPRSGWIAATEIEGDLFIDCTGFRGLLIGQALHVGYEDWSHWLFSDSAVAVQTESVREAWPYTRSIAREAGWQWRIPLQHRVGNGIVYCSRYLSDEQAKQDAAGEHRRQGARRAARHQVPARPAPRALEEELHRASGLASGFIEPLESTSIHLIQRSIIRLMQMFPKAGIQQSDIDEFNQQMSSEIEHIRDFIVLHYHVTNRQDTPFWRACRGMSIPPSLQHRIELFRETGRVFRVPNELFAENSWIQVMLGPGHHAARSIIRSRT